MNISLQNKQFWMSNALIIVSLCAALWFPTDNALQALASGVVFLVVLPLLFIKLFLKKTFASFGFSWGNIRQGSVWLIVLLVAIALCLVGIVQFTTMLNQFIVPVSIRSSFSMFLLYIMITGVYIMMFEFFFRGFVFFVWEKVIGIKIALCVQTILFIVFLTVGVRGNVDIFLIVIGAMSLLSGFLVFRSRSIAYSFLFSYISAILGIGSVILFVK